MKLMGRADIARYIGVSYARVRALDMEGRLPEPYAVINSGTRVFDGAVIEAWALTYRRPNAGRPKRQGT